MRARSEPSRYTFITYQQQGLDAAAAVKGIDAVGIPQPSTRVMIELPREGVARDKSSKPAPGRPAGVDLIQVNAAPATL